MTITIKKGETKAEIEAVKKRMQEKEKRPALADFYGKLKGIFGDGINSKR